MTDNFSTTVAVLGTGLMGAGIARNLARKGFAVRAWNRTAEKAQALKTDGIEAFDTPADTARNTDIIVTMLKDGPAVAIAKALGVDPALVVEAVTGGPLDGGFFQGKAAAILKGDYSTSFSVENAIKDAKLVVDALAGTGVRADLVAAGLTRFQRVAAAGHGEEDIAASFLA